MIKYGFTPGKESLKYSEEFNDPIDVMINYRTNSFVLSHTHDYWELVCMKENSVINVLDGNERVMHNRDFCLIRPENVHQLNRYDKNPPHYYNLMIRTEYLLSLVRMISPRLAENAAKDLPQYGTCEPSAHAEIIRLLDKIFNLPLERIVQRQHILRLVVIKLVSTLLTPKSTESAGNGLVSQFVSLMSTPENMSLSISKIAQKMGYTQEHIIRTFRKNGLEPPNHIFTSLKMEYARSLLSSTDIRTADIAELIGISDVSYFNKLFKKFSGVTPNAYRKNNPLH